MESILGREGLVLAWLEQHQGIIQGLASASAAMFVLTILAVVLVIIQIPEDYFVRDRRPVETGTRHWILHGTIVVLKNLAGVICILVGLALLVLPGQGLLLILIGLMLTNFPHKYELEQSIVSRASIRRIVNWIRRRAARPPLRTRSPEAEPAEQAGP